MLKSIATATGCECTKEHKNKVSYNTDCIVPDLNDFFLAKIEKRLEQKLKKEIFIFVKNLIN